MALHAVMLPLQATVRSAARHRCRPTTLATTSSFLKTTTLASTRRLNEVSHPTQPSATPRQPRKSIHTTSRSLKDKRWVNSAGEEIKQSSDTPDEEANKPVEGETEAESSKAAEERAKALAQKDGRFPSTVKASLSSSSSAPPSSSSPSSPSPPSDSSPPDSPPSSTGREIAKLSIPDVYPQVLALPITHRPLFPTFYKAVTITSQPVIKAIRELLAHGQPYIGAFLFKDAESDVFAQITSSFESSDKKKGEKDEGGQKALTVVLYPHRRVRIDELVTSPPLGGESVPIAKLVEETIKDEMDESEVASFEKGVPSVDSVKEDLGMPEIASETPRPGRCTSEDNGLNRSCVADSPIPPEQPRPHSQVGFLYGLLPEVSLTNVSNVKLEPYRKDSQMIRALMSELISAFKDLAQLQPIFREQSKPKPSIRDWH